MPVPNTLVTVITAPLVKSNTHHGHDGQCDDQNGQCDHRTVTVMMVSATMVSVVITFGHSDDHSLVSDTCSDQYVMIVGSYDHHKSVTDGLCVASSVA